MGTAFNVYITDIYFPYIFENQKLSNVRNLLYIGNNNIKLSLIYLYHHFKASFLMTENQMCICTIQNLVNTYKKRKVILWSKFYVNMATYYRTVSKFTSNVICKAIYLPAATVHNNNKYKFNIIHI